MRVGVKMRKRFHMATLYPIVLAKPLARYNRVMPQVGFDDERLRGEGMARRMAFNEQAEGSGIVGWMVSHRLAPSRRMAEMELLVLSILFFILAGYLFFRPVQSEPKVPPGMKVVTMPGDTPRLEPISQ